MLNYKKMYYKNKIRIIEFLEEIKTSVEKDELPEPLLQQVGEFYVKYLFTKTVSESENIELDKDDILKFISLGWFIYTGLLAEETTGGDLIN
jgi:hypothetical protein